MKPPEGDCFAFVAGGGTAGHVAPAVRVAGELARRHPGQSVRLVAAERGSGRELIDSSGLPYTLLPGRGLRRSWSFEAIGSNAHAMWDLARAIVRSLRTLAAERPRVVVTMGGFASIAPALGALVTGVPVVVVNVDAVPGAANRLVSRFARASAVAWPGTEMARATLTGAPVAASLEDLALRARPPLPGDPERAAAREALGLARERQVVAVFGGSLGARRLNEAAGGLAHIWADRSDRSIYHVTGQRDAGIAAAWRPDLEEGGLCYVQVPYEHRMRLLYLAADLVVCRAGAMTVSELALAGVPSVLVPLPRAPGDHQRANARVLERAGAAVVIDDASCSAVHLAEVVDGLLADGQRMDSMAMAAAALGRPGAAEAIGALVDQVASGAPA